MLQHLMESDVAAIIAAAELNNAAHPPSEHGITLAAWLDEPDRPDPTRKALDKMIRALSHEARWELMAVMWLGRGDAPGDFAECVAYAKGRTDEGDVNYIVEKSPALPLYLRGGMEILRRAETIT